MLTRLRYPQRLARRVVGIVREHPFRVADLPTDPTGARRFLRTHGDALALDLAALRRADFGSKGNDVTPVDRFRALLEQELSSPHRLSDLAVDGNDLIAVGFEPGPGLGHGLEQLLDEVVEEPELNTREQLLARARGKLAAS